MAGDQATADTPATATPEVYLTHTTFSREDYHGPRGLRITTDGGSVTLTVGLSGEDGTPVTTVVTSDGTSEQFRTWPA